MVSLERVAICSAFPRTLSVLVIALASSFSGCGASPFYDGDGVVRGRLFGPLHVELGRIDLSKREARRFTFAGLSRGSFIVKLVVPDAGPYPDLLKPPVAGPPPLDAVVRVVMVNENGERVIDEQAALGLWTRTTKVVGLQMPCYSGLDAATVGKRWYCSPTGDGAHTSILVDVLITRL
jgi:hypothetical protein